MLFQLPVGYYGYIQSQLTVCAEAACWLKIFESRLLDPFELWIDMAIFLNITTSYTFYYAQNAEKLTS